MAWKNQLIKTPYLVLFIIMISIGVGTASALVAITLTGNVIVTGDLAVEGEITGPTIEDLEQKFSQNKKNVKGNPFKNLQGQIDDIINGKTSIKGESKVLFLGNGISTGSPKNVYACVGGSTEFMLQSCTRNIPIGGDITTLTASAMRNGSVVFPGEEGKYKLTLMLNGVPTDLSCVIKGENTFCQNTSDSVRVVAGDRIDLQIKRIGNPNPANVAGSALLEP